MIINEQKYPFLYRIAGKLKFTVKSSLHRTTISKIIYDNKSVNDFKKSINNDSIIYEKEIEILPQLVSKKDVVLDIGANRGEYTYYLSRIVGPKGKVIAIEPGIRAFIVLQKIKNIFNLNNVETYRIGLSDKIGETKLIVPYYNRQAQIESLNSIKGKKEIIILTTLDEFCYSNNFFFNFIKCDTEGSELMILKGGREIIIKQKPIILLEVAEVHTNRFGYSANNVYHFLKDLGYQRFVYNNKTKKIEIIDKIVYKSEGHVWSKKTGNLSNNNYIFIHKLKIDNFQSLINNNKSIH